MKRTSLKGCLGIVLIDVGIVLVANAILDLAEWWNQNQ